MGTLLRRTKPTTCYFCQTTISPPPPQPRSFLCPHCACRNHYDANGDILSDDPAMHDESLNRESFARRASPPKDRLLTTFGSTPFCAACQSNQRLIVGLLSSYLPPSDDDPDYAPRLAGFADYKASIYARYPPVCEKCAPLVEEEIRKKDGMARLNALGSWLTESKKKDTRRQVSLLNADRHRLYRELRWWKARGILWGVTLLVALAADVAGAMGRLTLPEKSPLVPLLPGLALLSILWTAWLPTYAHFRRAELQGRKVRMHGRERYITLQAAAWAGRMLTASLIASSWHRPSMDFLSLRSRPALVGSRIYFGCTLYLRLLPCQHPKPNTNTAAPHPSSHPGPPLHVSTNSNNSTATPFFNPRSRAAAALALDPPKLLENLTLSSAPIPLRTWHAAGPVFGHPSLSPTAAASSSSSSVPVPTSRDGDTEMRSRDDEDEDAMDWTPTTSPVVRSEQALRDLLPPPPARRAGDTTTGLETLLERTNIIDSSEPGRMASWTRGRGGSAETTRTWSWMWVLVLSLVVPLAAVMHYHLLR
ncbi:Ima1 N-terminal domain-containing protein [Russula brevipes]|nr:Ima1 N-terminal domain-containing protein [Russula brevipes]